MLRATGWRWGTIDPMPAGTALSVEDYLQPLPPARREALLVVRRAILAHLPEGYEEIVAFGGICYCIPLERYPKTYNGRPLTAAALCARKSYLSLFIMPMFRDPVLAEWFQEEYRKTGKKLDMGKASLRFRTADDLPLDLVGKVIALITPEKYMAFLEEWAARKRNLPG